MDNQHYYAVIMAGGVGSRFWPVSKSDFPKQFHDMLGTGKSLLQTTFERVSVIVPVQNILILTNERYRNLVAQQLPEITSEQILLEPAMRNTAPCILYAAMKIQQKDPKAVMLVAPSDHWIEDSQAFKKDVVKSFAYSSAMDALITLGIKPLSPNTGYGYIQFDSENSVESFNKVIRFTEKPNFELAKSFLLQGNFLWNAGIFVWSVKAICEAFQRHQPALFSLFEFGKKSYNSSAEQAFIDRHYAESENISIDYAILEKAQNVWVLPASFDWNDLGTWGSLYDKLDKDKAQNAVVNARLSAENASGNIISTTSGKLVVIDGLSDFIVVETAESILIYPKSKEQNIKEVLSKVKNTYGTSYT